MKARRKGIWPGSLLAAALSASCGPSLPVPPVGPHVGDEPVEVPYPPPPAVPEIIPENKLGKKAVWVDGEYQWAGDAWAWQAGRWEVPSPDSYFARPQGLRMSDGRLMWFYGAWHPAEEARKTPPPP
jgi:hypothetical protein